MQVYTIYLDDREGYTTSSLDEMMRNVKAEIENCEVGQKVSVETGEMTKAAYSAMGEFAGW